MQLLPATEVESELSYAYLHAVAAKAGMSCQVTDRHADKMGIDAIIRGCGEFGGVLTDISLHVQLKATIKSTSTNAGKISFFINDLKQYDKYRRTTTNFPTILVVLFLPVDPDQWLVWTPQQLVLQRCAWWECLQGAPDSDNKSGQTVYLPEEQVFNPETLKGIFQRISCEEELRYHG